MSCFGSVVGGSRRRTEITVEEEDREGGTGVGGPEEGYDNRFTEKVLGVDQYSDRTNFRNSDQRGYGYYFRVEEFVEYKTIIGQEVDEEKTTNRKK